MVARCPPTSTSTSGPSPCSPPWRGAASRRACARTGTAWILELAGEPPAEVRLVDHDPVTRALLAERDGIDLVGLASSVPLGLESLPAAEAVPLLDAFFEGVLELGPPFRPWAAPALALPGAGALEIDDQLDRGALGACLPAAAVASEVGLVRRAALLDRLQARDAPLLVHPGPARTGAEAPAWWAPMTSYVAEMQSAWLAWAAWGRAAHPRLRVVFAMLAGGAPLHAERLAARGGPAGAVHDELTFFDVSSYGPRTVDAMLRVVGRRPAPLRLRPARGRAAGAGASSARRSCTRSRRPIPLGCWDVPVA